jgi:hypothetical protein
MDDNVKLLAIPNCRWRSLAQRDLQPNSRPLPRPMSTRAGQAHLHFMPALSGDKGDATDGDPDTRLTLLPSQYILGAWAK